MVRRRKRQQNGTIRPYLVFENDLLERARKALDGTGYGLNDYVQQCLRDLADGTVEVVASVKIVPRRDSKSPEAGAPSS